MQRDQYRPLNRNVVFAANVAEHISSIKLWKLDGRAYTEIAFSNYEDKKLQAFLEHLAEKEIENRGVKYMRRSVRFQAMSLWAVQGIIEPPAGSIKNYKGHVSVPEKKTDKGDIHPQNWCSKSKDSRKCLHLVVYQAVVI